MSRIFDDAQPAPPRVGCVLLRSRLGARGRDGRVSFGASFGTAAHSTLATRGPGSGIDPDAVSGALALRASTSAGAGLSGGPALALALAPTRNGIANLAAFTIHERNALLEELDVIAGGVDPSLFRESVSGQGPIGAMALASSNAAVEPDAESGDSPVYTIPEVIFLDPSSKTEQYGGPDGWARCVKGYLNARGYSASVAVAPSRDAALAAARSRWGIVVIHDAPPVGPTRVGDRDPRVQTGVGLRAPRVPRVSEVSHASAAPSARFTAASNEPLQRRPHRGAGHSEHGGRNTTTHSANRSPSEPASPIETRALQLGLPAYAAHTSHSQSSQSGQSSRSGQPSQPIQLGLPGLVLGRTKRTTRSRAAGPARKAS